MKVSTTRFGEIEVASEEIIEFPEGLLGFEDAHRFVILNPQDGGPFRWMQSLEDGNLAFVILEPLQFMFVYDLEITDQDASFLGLTRAEDAVLYAIVTIPENARDMTANLQGPLVINVKNRKGRQVISTDSRHSVRVKILDEMEKRAKKVQEQQPQPDSPKKEGKG